MIRIVPLKFQQAGRQYDFNAQALELKPGDRVIVETDRGRAMATVVIPPREIEADAAPDGLKSILRVATDEDMALAQANSAREKDAHKYCLERISSRQLEMKLVRAEYAFDGSKIIFFFTADGRIDFRELVKDLAHYFHTRIEMRQIGVRDEAKLVGGLGICGRELCCCSFLTQFNPVSVKMAKEQGLALNPTKISGQCGRLLCCLGYEFETYSALKKGLPKCGKKISWQDREHEVTNVDILRQQISLRDREGSSCCITLKELQSGQLEKPKEQEEPVGESHTSRLNKGKSESRRPSGKKKQPAKKTTPTEPQKPAEQSKKQPQQEKAEGAPQKKRRRRGRRRPRGGRKPDQNNQGE
jgi:cell fate regulator YaaT (PSP1 superfamily)